MTPTQLADREFWVAVYRAGMALCAAVKRYKLGCVEPPGDALAPLGAETRTAAGVQAQYTATPTVQSH